MSTHRVERRIHDLYNRLPLLGHFIRRNARELSRELNPVKVQALAEVACATADDDVRAIALRALDRSLPPGQVDELVAVWTRTRSPDLHRLIASHGWIARQPATARVLSALATGQGGALASEGAEVVGPLVDASADEDPKIAAAASSALGSLSQPAAREALCALIIEGDHPKALAVCLSAGYVPQEPDRRALYYFLTGQTALYEDLDFDRRWLQMAYATAPPPLRERIRNVLRASGRLDFLTVIAGSDYRSRAAALGSEELAVLVTGLAQLGEWEKLWRLALEVVPAWSQRILIQLAGSGWQPQRAKDAELVRVLGQLINGTPLPAAALVAEWAPPAIRLALVRVPGRANALDFSPTAPVLAIGTGNRRVVLWNYQTGKREHTYREFARSVGHVAFTSTGCMVAGERTQGDRPCALYSWAAGGDGRPNRDGIVLARYDSSVTALCGGLNGHILAGGHDAVVSLYDVAAGRTVASRDFDDWPRGIAVRPQGDWAVLLHEQLTLVRLPVLEACGMWGMKSTARSGAFSADGSALFVGKADGVVEQWEFDGVRLRGKQRPFTYHDRPVHSVHVLKSRNILLSADSSGTISLDTCSGQGAHKIIEGAASQLTLLSVSPGGEFMAVGEADSAFSLWDLRLLDLPPIFERPLATMAPADLAVVRLAKLAPALDERLVPGLGMIEALLQYRLRYDVEVDEPRAIRPGEYDIEIEG